MKRFGLALGGCETAIEELIKSHVKTYKPEDTYTMIEIGSAGCVTLRAIKDIISENRPTNWSVIGFDLIPGKAWSLDWPEINRAFDGDTKNVWDMSNGTVCPARFDSKEFADRMHLVLLENPRQYLKDLFGNDAGGFRQYIDFAFIDGCHGKCSRDDFEAIESKVRQGGLVMFHDVGVLEQGRDFQPHCNEYINVRKHITDLGLLNETRPGWRLVGEIPGSRVWGGDGNSCAVFQKL